MGRVAVKFWTRMFCTNLLSLGLRKNIDNEEKSGETFMVSSSFVTTISMQPTFANILLRDITPFHTSF